MKKLRLLLATLLAIVGVTRSMAQEAYAVYTPNNTTLTFYYDNQRSSRTGTTYDLNTGNSEPAWYYANYEYGIYGDVTKVVFDSSFANARPTSTSNWFLEMENLTTITGLEYLNTSEVTTMAGMFSTCSKLTSIDLSHFDTGNVTDMNSMFDYCINLTSLDLSHFDTSKVTNMVFMFNHCSKLTTLDLASFNTANVTNMVSMFHTCSNLTTIIVGGGWSTEKVRTSNDMFIDCTNLIGGAGTAYQNENPVDKTYARIDDPDNGKPGYFTWPPSSTPYALLSTDGSTLTFYYDEYKATRTGTTYDIPWSERYPEWAGTSEGDNTTVTTVDFDSSFAYYHDLVNTSFMFYRMSALTTINNLDRLNTENVTDMMSMFVKCSSLETIDVSHFNTEKVTNMMTMFANCNRLKRLDLTSFNTQNVVAMTFMFYQDFSLEEIFCNDNWYKEDVGTDEMFTYCISLKGAIDYDENKVTAEYANPETGYFTRTNGPLPYAALSTDNTTLTFYYDNQRLTRDEKTYPLRWKDYPEWTGSSGNSTITTVNFDASFARYHGLTYTHDMFSGLRNLATINSLENLNTENVTDMSYMFNNCYSLSSLDVSYFNTRSVTNMNYMFSGCSSLSTIICPNDWKKDGITSTSMFIGCNYLVGAISYDSSKLTVDYANPKTGYFSTGGVPYAVLNGTTLTFYYDSQKGLREGTTYNIPWGGGYPGWTRSSGNTTITTVDFDASFANYYGLQSAQCMFFQMTALTAINNLDRLNTDNVTDMSRMFAVCNKLSSLDLTNFKTDNVTDMELMFVNCSNLRIIYCNDNWYHTGLSSDDMFNGCSKLGSLALPALDWDKLDANYANPTTGYFTQKASSQQGNTNDNLIVGLIPSNNNKLEIVDNSGEVVSYVYNTAMISIDKGANYVIRAYNSFSAMKTNLFVNGVDRTEELVDNIVNGTEVKELFLRNVEENLVIEARYTPINYEVMVSSTEGGETTMYYTNSTNDDTYSSTLNNENYFTNSIKYGTDVRFVFKPNQGYELGFVVSGWNRSICEDCDVVPLSDGTYEFILPASGFYNAHAEVTVYYKKVGGSNGDVNGDGEVNIADVTKLVNEILKQE